MEQSFDGSGQRQRLSATLAGARERLRLQEEEVSRLAAEAARAIAEHQDFKERLKPIAAPASYLVGELTRLDSAARSAIHRKQKAEAELGPIRAGIADLAKALQQLDQMGL